MNKPLDSASCIQQLENYQLTNQTRKAVFDIVRWFDDLYKDGQFDQVNQILTQIDVSKFEEDILVGLLAFTFATRDLLPARMEFIDRVMKRINQLYPEREAEDIIGEVI